MSQKPDPKWLRQQVEAYAKEFPTYQTYAQAMARMLELARKPAVPQAIVEARPKSIASFAEKCVRKWPKYKDPVHQLTDLCGARIIVQTLGQVQAAKLFVESNFAVDERDDKTTGLGEDKFGYRDMHYLVRLRRDRALAIGFTAAECDAIGNRTAELQVRSVVQHAWADILHDRLYKSPLRLSVEAKRTGALLAAIMEDGDRSFDRLADEVDGMFANYAAHASKQAVGEEIERQELILARLTERESRAKAVLQLARLYGSCGDHDKALSILEPFANDESPAHLALLLELGNARCRVHRGRPTHDVYRSGQSLLERVVELCRGTRHDVIPDLRQRTSLLARALSALAWSWSAQERDAAKARDQYRQALEVEPSNPYHLANQLGFEIYCARNRSMLASMRSTIVQAIETCRQHAVAGIELPFAAFTAARLSLLIGDPHRTMGYYARGLRHLCDGDSCVQTTVLADEMQWVERIYFGEPTAKEHAWSERLVPLCRAFHEAQDKGTPGRAAAGSDLRVLIVAGGARSIDPETLTRVEPCLRAALAAFQGTVISGGTDVGVPGLVGRVWEELGAGRGSTLVGYVPDPLPRGETRHPGYNRFEACGHGEFSPEEILRTWEDLQRQGIRPEQVLVLGIGGGPLSLVEYHVGLAMGARVAVLQGTGGAADAILADPLWSGVKSLLALPEDRASFQALATVPRLVPQEVDAMARAFHEHYVEDNPGKLPPGMQPWEKLATTFRTASLEQARYAIEILRAAGFDVRAKSGKADAIESFAGAEYRDDVERMAELEHGRWIVERLRDGWRYGRPRNDAQKIHDCLVRWRKAREEDKVPELPDDIREYDRNSVRAFPEILGIAGLEIFRPQGAG